MQQPRPCQGLCRNGRSVSTGEGARCTLAAEVTAIGKSQPPRQQASLANRPAAASEARGRSDGPPSRCVVVSRDFPRNTATGRPATEVIRSLGLALATPERQRVTLLLYRNNACGLRYGQATGLSPLSPLPHGEAPSIVEVAVSFLDLIVCSFTTGIREGRGSQRTQLAGPQQVSDGQTAYCAAWPPRSQDQQGKGQKAPRQVNLHLNGNPDFHGFPLRGVDAGRPTADIDRLRDTPVLATPAGRERFPQCVAYRCDPRRWCKHQGRRSCRRCHTAKLNASPA